MEPTPHLIKILMDTYRRKTYYKNSISGTNAKIKNNPKKRGRKPLNGVIIDTKDPEEPEKTNIKHLIKILNNINYKKDVEILILNISKIGTTDDIILGRIFDALFRKKTHKGDACQLLTNIHLSQN